MRKADPDFEWKTPIEFYGQVVDQFGNAVEGATVDCSWTTVVGPSPDPERKILSETNGLFSITGIRGKYLCLEVDKEGYRRTGTSHGGFEYANFSNGDFYVPDSKKPVIFRLHKVTEAQPLTLFGPAGSLFAGTPLTLEVDTGKIAEDGDISLAFVLGPGPGQYGPDYQIVLQASGGAGFVVTDEEFPSLAPEAGYQTALALKVSASDSHYERRKNIHFYVRTRTGRYAVIGLVVDIPPKGITGHFEAGIRFNPSGSRNLELGL